MDDSKALFDYWHDQVQLKNHERIAAFEHIPTHKLRHECTNYDKLRHSLAVQSLEEPERSKVIAVIKYECTAKVLQHRAGLLREQAQQFETAYRDLNQEFSTLRKLLLQLKKKLFGKDQEIQQLQNQIRVLTATNEALQAEAETGKAYSELMTEFEQLKQQYQAVEKRRQELARNNMSLGGRVAHTKRYKQQRDEAQAQLKSLTQENQKLQQENETLRQAIAALQKLNASYQEG